MTASTGGFEGRLAPDPTPLVSVIIPAYQVSEFIAESVGSVLNQTYRPLEAIVINDGSPDTAQLEARLAPFRDRVRYLSQVNQGAAVARNAGIAVAQGSLIAFLDGDDMWYPEFLASQVSFLLAGGYDMVYSNALLFGDHREDGLEYMQTSPSRGPVTLQSLLTLTCQPITSGTMVRRTILDGAGVFDPALLRGQDFELWVRLAHVGARIGYQCRVLLKHRVHPGSLSGTPLQRVLRELSVFERIRSKLVLPGPEARIVDRQVRRLGGLVELERGKGRLAVGDYQGARTYLRAACRVNPSMKLRLARTLIKVAPRFMRKIYERFRPPFFAGPAPSKPPDGA